MSTRSLIQRSRAKIENPNAEGFLIIEALIALATLVLFSLIIMTMRYQLVRWHVQGQRYLQAVSIAGRTFERLMLKQPIPDRVNQFTIQTNTQHEKVPYTHVEVIVSWPSLYGEKHELRMYGGMVDEA